MDELLSQFLVEARELVQQATDDLLELERNPGHRDRLDSAFRAVHTLKGSVGLFDLAPMGVALHAGEDLLGALRDGRANLDRASVDLLLDLIGHSERWLDALEGTGGLPSQAPEAGERLAHALRQRLPALAAAGRDPAAAAEAGWAQALLEDSFEQAQGASLHGSSLLAIRYVPHPECFFAGDDPMQLMRAVPELVAVRILPRQPWPPADQLDPFSCNLIIEALTRSPLSEVQPIFRFVPDQVSFGVLQADDKPPSGAEELSRPDQASGSMPGAGSLSLRVDAKKIDRLVDLVGELVVAKNMLAFVGEQASQGLDLRQLLGGISSSQAAITRLVADLHAAVMGVRMLPLRDALRGLPRAVRDLSVRLGKEVEFSMQGEGVEADKAVVEGLFEPLLHLVRNAVDHGIEPHEARRAGGKPSRGRIDLRADREGDRLMIAITDDGRGIDPAVIRRVARERELYPDPVLDTMPEPELINLIFAPGFSTAGEITDVSGRGVGMDAVRAAVERLGGRVSVSSVLGQGTTVRLVLPVTVVITQVMVVRAGPEAFGIPLDAVVETTRVARDRVIPVGGGEAFVFRDRTFPLLRLASLLQVPGEAGSDQDLRVVLVQAGPDLVGLAVDGFGERLDAMLRPMTGLLARLPGFAGTTIRGNGGVLMVLDLPELIACR